MNISTKFGKIRFPHKVFYSVTVGGYHKTKFVVIPPEQQRLEPNVYNTATNNNYT